MRILDYTTFEKGITTSNGVIAVCPKCNKKGARMQSPTWKIFLHSQEISDSDPLHALETSQSCHISATDEEIQLYKHMCLLVGGSHPEGTVYAHYKDIWKGGKDNLSRLASFRSLLLYDLYKKIDPLKAKIIETDDTFMSLNKEFYKGKSE